MRIIYKDVIILSAQLSSLTAPVNAKRHNDLLKTLAGWSIDYIETVGVYKGQREISVLCVPRTFNQLQRLKNLALESFGQESVLVQDNEGRASLVFKNDATMALGQLKPISKDEANTLDAYTIVNGQYWAAK